MLKAVDLISDLWLRSNYLEVLTEHVFAHLHGGNGLSDSGSITLRKQPMELLSKGSNDNSNRLSHLWFVQMLSMFVCGNWRALWCLVICQLH